MTIQPSHLQHPTTQARQPDTDAAARRIAALEFLADIESIVATPTTPQKTPTTTSFRDPTPTPTIGNAPPVPQPGRPAMSERAVDLNTTILSSSVVIGMTGAATTGVLWASHHANPTVIAWVCACVVAAPAAIAIPVLALKSLMKSAKNVVEAAPPEHHHHYNGTVNQTTFTTNSETRGIWATTRNQSPR